jgi:3-(3-hydroxy-phenyl)propionate hydroxylase
MPPPAEWATPLARNGVVDRRHRPTFMVEQTARAYGHPQVVRLDQPAREAALRAAAIRSGCVQILTGC